MQNETCDYSSGISHPEFNATEGARRWRPIIPGFEDAHPRGQIMAC